MHLFVLGIPNSCHALVFCLACHAFSWTRSCNKLEDCFSSHKWQRAFGLTSFEMGRGGSTLALSPCCKHHWESHHKSSAEDDDLTVIMLHVILLACFCRMYCLTRRGGGVSCVVWMHSIGFLWQSGCLLQMGILHHSESGGPAKPSSGYRTNAIH